MWAALRDGAGLNEILNDFYGRVYQDPRLAHFFEGVTIDRAIEKQYSFLRQIFTGDRCYFGDRPRNAHHWMIISDELFDYREELMMTCLRRYGLSEELIAQWRAAEEQFRKQIVKDTPIPKKVRGLELPLEGYQRETLTVGSLCDGCGLELPDGSIATYHVRTGRTFCDPCSPNNLEESAHAGGSASAD